jgi:hypothetical protein
LTTSLYHNSNSKQSTEKIKAALDAFVSLLPCKHAHSTHITLKLNCSASENAKETIIKLIREFVGELASADSTAAILP